ncbi:synaptotagmin-5-like isoform X2 [Numida meleagris]|uniref:synaptotagmin-5-like isoform X2 n=1 Tax=Numida meleagris TaxID=8996 RepID=UPI000B3DF0B7|nr:synaptotagmin-5-like isoform X2 [Numida meleagris]
MHLWARGSAPGGQRRALAQAAPGMCAKASVTLPCSHISQVGTRTASSLWPRRSYPGASPASTLFHAYALFCSGFVNIGSCLAVWELVFLVQQSNLVLCAGSWLGGLPGTCSEAVSEEKEDRMQNSSITLRLHSLQLPLSSTWKYGIMALAILLLLGALTILAYQMCQLQKHRRTGKKKKCDSGDGVRMRAENGLWGKKMLPLLLDSSQQSDTDMEMVELGVGLDAPQPCLSCRITEDASSDPSPLPSSRGSLKFSLLYHREQRELLVSGLEVRGLPSRRHTEVAVWLRLLQHVPSCTPGLQCVVQEWQSRAVKNCSGTAFGEHFICSLQDAEVDRSTLKLEVQHFDKYSRSATLGEVRVALSQLRASQSLILCAELQKTTKDIVGEVLLSLRCLPISQRMEVGLLKAKTTPPCSAAEKSIYARIDVSCRRHKQKHQKSRPQAHTSLIIFNETFLFPMPQAAAWDCSVLISLYEVGPEPKHLIGQASVGRSMARDAADHWDLMAKSIQQPVAQWHPLLI